MMREWIKGLEARSAPLDPGPRERAALQDRVLQYADAFLEGLPQRPAFQATDDQGAGILDSPLSEGPLGIDQVLKLLADHVDHPGVNVGSPGYVAFIPVSGLYVSALADYLASVTNRYAGVFFASPGAVRVERMLLEWMADFVGYPPTATGDLTSGGSIANLVGLVTARDARDLRARDYHRTVVYLSRQVHHSVDKALRIAGLEDCIKRYVPLDETYRLHADSLSEAIADDRREGLDPWAIVASAGTTDSGAVDPLVDLAEIAEREGLWLHVDGAYGAMFALCDPRPSVLDGLDRSDSLVLDPHKGLFMPLGSGAVLVKDGQKQVDAHRYHASYLQDKDVLASPGELSPADLSPELSRPFRGLRLWLALKLAGVAPFRAALEEKLLLARYFYEKVQGLEGCEVGPPPDLSIVPFRFVPPRGDADDFNRRLAEAIQRDGRIFMSSTVIDDHVTLRMAVLGFRTHLDTVDLALEILKEKAAEVTATA
ncbi:pyridoxal phosphate-dependent decarboxylase family protein [Gemmatimonadota bacterium]